MDNKIETGAYILRNLVSDVALSADGDNEDVHITCVELWQDNLYIGTSLGEVLHHVRLPPDPSNPDEQPTYILASRQKPPVNQPEGPGIQEILLLPWVGKACILSNNTLNFYALPELTPVFATSLTCGWIGGVDLDADPEALGAGVLVFLCLKQKIRPVKVAEKPIRLRDIEFGGCLSVARRGNVACVADSRSYALLDIVLQRKNELFPISSADEQLPAGAGYVADDSSSTSGTDRGLSPDPLKHTLQQERGHRKTASLNIFRREGELLADAARPANSQRYGFDTPAAKRATARRVSTTDIGDVGGSADLSKPLPPPPPPSIPELRAMSRSPPKPMAQLRPLIVSPNPRLFLLVTGSAPDEPAIGMFVNLDGDLERGTMEFSSYPESLVVDGAGQDMSSSLADDGQAEEGPAEEGYVLAVVQRTIAGAIKKDVEIQRWDVDPGEGVATKEWLNLPSISDSDEIGLRSLNEKTTMPMTAIGEKLAKKPYKLMSSLVSDESSNPGLEKEELQIIEHLSKCDARIVLWRSDKVFWLLRNPTVLKLDARLRLAQSTSLDPVAPISPQRRLIEVIFNEIQNIKPIAELDVLTVLSLAYIRQKCAILLLMDLVNRTLAGTRVPDDEKLYTENALIDSAVDPRLVLSFLPSLRQEVLQGPDGIWLPGGLRDICVSYFSHTNIDDMSTDPRSPYGENLLEVVKRFLVVWRKKKGNPSVADGANVFYTVDAALLHILLILDSIVPPGPALPGSYRQELHAIVDKGVECYDRAVELLERYKRLYVLSWLYQKRKSSTQVLSTWKRIIGGEEDAGGEFVDGEMELRKYLGKLKDRALVIEYGTWLANRSPKIGVQVFADEHSKVHIPMAEALHILREQAPNAVKDYLEYLVFGKKQSQHINELIAYYLDIVLHELETSVKTKAVLLETYETYRALQPPKPTYRQFINDNAVRTEWWSSRLRLLHLLGSNQGPASSYDVSKILSRLKPYAEALVPEMIILNGRQGRHAEALALLTHRLGDFDAAVSYCLLGGLIFRPPSGTLPPESMPRRDEQAQLFAILLKQFLALEDVDERKERTGELLERFGAWFDSGHVLALLPEDWAVNIFGTWLVKTLQKLVRERNESIMVRALAGAQSLKVSGEFVEKALDIGPVVEDGSGTVAGGGGQSLGGTTLAMSEGSYETIF